MKRAFALSSVIAAALSVMCLDSGVAWAQEYSPAPLSDAPVIDDAPVPDSMFGIAPVPNNGNPSDLEYSFDSGTPSCCDSVRSECCVPCCCRQRFYTQLEALFFDRDTRFGSQPVAIQVTNEANAFPGSTVLSVSDAAPGSTTGARVLVGWFADDCRAWEASYFGLWGLDGSATATATNNLAIPGDLGLAALDFFAADTITVSYTSRVNNAELNHIWLRGNLSWLAGLRYLSLEEALNLQGTDSDTGTSNYNISTRNNLFGGQLGARYQRHWNRWGFDTTAKAGIYYNDAMQSQFVQDFPPGFFLRPQISSSSDTVAFVGDLNFSLTYQLTNHWALRGGYNLIWIEGVATAPGQLDFTDTLTSGSLANTSGGLFLHGVNLGLEGRW